MMVLRPTLASEEEGKVEEGGNEEEGFIDVRAGVFPGSLATG